MSTGSSGSLSVPQWVPGIGRAWSDPIEPRRPPPRVVPPPLATPSPVPIPLPPRPASAARGGNGRRADEVDTTFAGLLAEALGRPELLVTIVSATAHMVLIILLALLTLSPVKREALHLTASVDDEPTRPDLIETPPIDMPMVAQGPLLRAAVQPTAPMVAPVKIGFDPDAPKVLASLNDRILGDVARAGGAGGPDAVSFFNQTTVAKRVVFIVDASTSMDGSKFERAKDELLTAVGALTPQQRFFVYFFSDKDYAMFAPRTPTEMVALDTLTWDKLVTWVGEQELVGDTKPRKAVQRAFGLQPDVIYLLTDGDFNDDTYNYLMRLSNYKVRVNTIGFQVGSKAKGELERIARKFRGEFTEVQ